MATSVVGSMACHQQFRHQTQNHWDAIEAEINGRSTFYSLKPYGDVVEQANHCAAHTECGEGGEHNAALTNDARRDSCVDTLPSLNSNSDHDSEAEDDEEDYDPRLVPVIH